jgi:SAM-dependent methyltransferase
MGEEVDVDALRVASPPVDDPVPPSDVLERATPFVPVDVAYPQSTWTSFDRYDRYAEIARIVRATLGPGTHRVLDVGDAAGHLALFEPDLWVAGLDLVPAPSRLPCAVPINGDGTALPFADGTFDAVVTSDVLEHIPPPGRPAFLAELTRVSRGLVVVAAPFNTAGVAGAEEFVRRFAAIALGAPQPQLEEHRDNGLPGLDDTMQGLGAHGRSVLALGNGNLWDWISSMLLRFQLEARPALGPLSGGFDELHNQAFGARRAAGPYYRHVVVASPFALPDEVVAQGTGFAVGTGGYEAPSDPGIDLTALASVIIAADTTEVVRQDVHGIVGDQVLPPLHDTQAHVRALKQQVDALGARVEEMNARLTAEIGHLHERSVDSRARLEELFQSQVALTGPLLKVRAKVVALRNRLTKR